MLALPETIGYDSFIATHQPDGNMNTITLKQVQALKAAGRVVYGYPVKGMVCVDGFKYFKATTEVAKAAKAQ